MNGEEHIDQLGNIIKLPSRPLRIVSLVPSQTELLYYLGIKPIAQTLFCIHPKIEFDSSTKIGGTKKLNMTKIRKLNPDLIIGNKEENDRNQIEELAKEFPVWMSDIYTIADAFEMMEKLSRLLAVEVLSAKLIQDIKEAMLKPSSVQNALYLIWRNPYMAAGSNTFINSMMNHAGYKNVIDKKSSRYPELSHEDIAKLDPECILLSSEPYPFKEKHMKELRQICPKAHIRLVDGEMFSWYGSRMLNAPVYFKSLRES